MKFSVIMPVYKNTNSDYFEQAVKSVTELQTITPDELVIVEDGPTSSEVTRRIEEVIQKYTIKIIRYKFPVNVGLGVALAKGVELSTNDVIARMDDDGAHTMADALAMAQVAVDNGISHILVTPHHMDGKYTNHKADVIQRTAEFQAALDEAKIDLVVFPGQEAHINGDLMQAIKNDDVLFADKTNRYLMLELPHSEVPEYTNQMIFESQAAGITPVIVHPERNHGIQKKRELLYDFVASGCLTQITASSYLGVFGDKVADFTQRIMMPA